MTDKERAAQISDLAIQLSTAIADAKNDGLSVDVNQLMPYKSPRSDRYLPYVLLEVTRRQPVLNTSIGGVL